MPDDVPEIGPMGPRYPADWLDQVHELMNGAGVVVGTVAGSTLSDPYVVEYVVADGQVLPPWALSWPSGASEPVWAPELPEITPRPAQPR